MHDPKYPPPPPPRSVRGVVPRQIRKERPTFHIRFRRGWFGRLIIQIELVVHWYDWRKEDQGPVKSGIEWRDANKEEMEEISRGHFQPE